MPWPLKPSLTCGGQLRLPLDKHAKVAEDPSTKLPKPKWQSLSRPGGGTDGGMGEVLMSLQLVKKESEKQDLPTAPSLVPATREATIEIVCLGVRNLLPHMFLPIAQP